MTTVNMYWEAFHTTTCYKWLSILWNCCVVFGVIGIFIGVNYGIMLLWYGPAWQWNAWDIVFAMLAETMSLLFLAGLLTSFYEVICDPKSRQYCCWAMLFAFVLGMLAALIYFCIRDWQDARWLLLSLGILIVVIVICYGIYKSQKEMEAVIQGYEDVQNELEIIRVQMQPLIAPLPTIVPTIIVSPIDVPPIDVPPIDVPPIDVPTEVDADVLTSVITEKV